MRSTQRARGTGVLGKLMLLAVVSLSCLAMLEVAIRITVPVRNVGPAFSTYDAEYGRVLKRDVSLMRYTPEFSMRFTSNGNGFRGPDLEGREAGSLLFVGDSFTMGYGVTDGEEFPALIRSALAAREPPHPLEVINAGMGNNGTGRPLKFLRDDAPALDPRIVVVQIHGNDYGDNDREGLFRLAADGSLRELPVPPPGASNYLQTIIESVPGLTYLHVVGLARQLRFGGSSKTDHIDPEAILKANRARADRLERLLLGMHTKIVDVGREAGWQQIVVLADVSEPRLSALIGFFGNREIPTVVIPTKEQRPDLYFVTDGHWNKAGQAYAAERVLEALDELESSKSTTWRRSGQA